jgi:hypothetical protein
VPLEDTQARALVLREGDEATDVRVAGAPDVEDLVGRVVAGDDLTQGRARRLRDVEKEQSRRFQGRLREAPIVTQRCRALSR